MTHLLESYGLAVLFLLVAVESSGVPLPGESTLIAAAVLASQGHYSIVEVIVVAAVAAIVGDNVGYWLGRRGGTALLRRTPIVRDHFERVLPRAEAFFIRHGPKTVFIGRFVAVLRVTSAWLAGISHMPWWKFLIWNAAGGICWAVLVGVVAYEFGGAVIDAVSHYGVFAVIGLVVLAALALIARTMWRRRAARDLGHAPE